MSRIATLICCLIIVLSPACRAAEPRQYFAGADVSMLLELEKAGAVYRETDQPRDAIQILRDHGCNLFRLRLFVDPDPEFRKSAGATQNLQMVKQLARRIKAAGGSILLDIHYSDTWADPAHQHKPRVWKDLAGVQLENQVYEYTAGVLAEMKKDDLVPAIVQVGNEITGGILWPDGKVLDAPKDQEAEQWARFARLVSAGCRAVREASTPERPIRIAIHIHGGGRPGLPQWFFGKLNQNPVDCDILALSFYPQWGDSLEAMKKNVTELINQTGKDVLLAEVSYPWKPIDGIKDMSLMQWPLTREGQSEFIDTLNQTVKTFPDSHLMGYVWWYPEAIPVTDPALHIWKSGGEALFDESGRPLPAMLKFGELTR